MAYPVLPDKQESWSKATDASNEWSASRTGGIDKNLTGQTCENGDNTTEGDHPPKYRAQLQARPLQTALESSHKLAHQAGDLPFGIVFACFMGAMMLGSMLFTKVMSSSTKWLTCRDLLQTVVTLGAVSLLFTIFFRSEWLTFWSFCLFEACVGMYFPSMGYQKGKVIDDGNRAHLYGLLRIPYNLFVVVALSLTREGKERRCTHADTHLQRLKADSMTGDVYREIIFMCCSGLLLIVSAVIGAFLHT